MSIEVKQESGDGSVVVTDAKGRKLTLKEPDFIMESRITRLCGDSSTNIGYMYAYVLPSIQVVKIDDDPVPFPATFLQLEGLISRVGREGAAAVINHIKESSSQEDHEAAVKN